MARACWQEHMLWPTGTDGRHGHMAILRERVGGQEALASYGGSTRPTPHLRAAGELVLPDLPEVGLAFKQPFGRFRRRLHRTEQEGLSAHVHVSWPRADDRLLAGLVCRAEHTLIAPLVPDSWRRGNGEHCRKLLAVQLRGDLNSGSHSRA